MKKQIQTSNFWHTVLCISAFTYNLFYIVIIAIGLVNISVLQKTFLNYIESDTQHSHLYFYILSLLLLTLCSSFGLIKLFLLKKSGLYIYTISTLVLMIFKYLFITVNWIEIGLLSTYLLFFLMMRRKYS